MCACVKAAAGPRVLVGWGVRMREGRLRGLATIDCRCCWRRCCVRRAVCASSTASYACGRLRASTASPRVLARRYTAALVPPLLRQPFQPRAWPAAAFLAGASGRGAVRVADLGAPPVHASLGRSHPRAPPIAPLALRCRRLSPPGVARLSHTHIPHDHRGLHHTRRVQWRPRRAAAPSPQQDHCGAGGPHGRHGTPTARLPARCCACPLRDADDLCCERDGDAPSFLTSGASSAFPAARPARLHAPGMRHSPPSCRRSSTTTSCPTRRPPPSPSRLRGCWASAPSGEHEC